MPLTRSRHAQVRPVILVGVVMTVFASCSGGTSRSTTASTDAAKVTTTTEPVDAPTTGATAAPVSGDPAPGQCLAPMTAPIARSYQLPGIVECSRPHGGEIISIQQLDPDPAASYPALGQRLTGADDELTSCAGTDSNSGEFEQFVGANHLDVKHPDAKVAPLDDAWAVSGVEAAAFVPNPDQWARGQRWLVCAAVVNNSAVAPAAYDGSVKGSRAKPGELSAQFAWCKVQRSDGSPTDDQAVACTAPHNYEQVASFPAATSETDFPGEPALDALGTTWCKRLASLATGGRTDKLADTFGISWSFPQSADWSDGDRVVRCYVSTRNGLSSGSVGSGTEAVDS